MVLISSRRLTLAALSAAGILAACTAPTPSSVAMPSRFASPQVVPTASAAPASPPAMSPAMALPYQPLSLPAEKIRTLVLDGELGVDFQIHRYSGWGPRVVFDALSEKDAPNLYLADLERGTLEVAASVTKAQWEVWEPDISADWIVWTQYRYDHPASHSGALSFQVEAKNLASSTAHEVTSGVHVRLEGGQAIPPLIRVDGDQVVYAVEHTRPGHPLGWRIMLQSLTSGDVERTFDTDLDLYQLDLSEGNVLYSEGQADLEASYKYGLRLMLSTADHPDPVQIAHDAYDLSISGDRFAWMSDPQAAESPMPVRPVIMTATVSDPTPRQVSVTTTAPASPPPGWGRPRLGGMFPATGGGLVAWQDRQTDGLTWDGQLDRLPLWDSRSGVGYQLEPAPDPLFVRLEGGWLTWYTDFDGDRLALTHVFHGLPIADLPLPAAATLRSDQDGRF
jgi:hypothetical protein